VNRAAKSVSVAASDIAQPHLGIRVTHLDGNSCTVDIRLDTIIREV
jgi:hypothetical protein